MKLLTGNFHRKLAVIDRTILWEGSLNILSQNRSQKVMSRIEKLQFQLRFIFMKIKEGKKTSEEITRLEPMNRLTEQSNIKIYLKKVLYGANGRS